MQREDDPVLRVVCADRCALLPGDQAHGGVNGIGHVLFRREGIGRELLRLHEAFRADQFKIICRSYTRARQRRIGTHEPYRSEQRDLPWIHAVRRSAGRQGLFARRFRVPAHAQGHRRYLHRKSREQRLAGRRIFRLPASGRKNGVVIECVDLRIVGIGHKVHGLARQRFAVALREERVGTAPDRDAASLQRLPHDQKHLDWDNLDMLLKNSDPADRFAVLQDPVRCRRKLGFPIGGKEQRQLQGRAKALRL